VAALVRARCVPGPRPLQVATHTAAQCPFDLATASDRLTQVVVNACPATAILDDPRICTDKAWQATVLENPKQSELVSSMTELSQLAGQVKELHSTGVRVNEDRVFSPYGIMPIFSYVSPLWVRAGTGGTFWGPGWSV